jgi:hypothetical protein
MSMRQRTEIRVETRQLKSNGMASGPMLALNTLLNSSYEILPELSLDVGIGYQSTVADMKSGRTRQSIGMQSNSLRLGVLERFRTR